MNRQALIDLLSKKTPAILAENLVDCFLQIRQDVQTGVLERAQPGKFVEYIVQVLDFLETRTFPEKPDVDLFLRTLENRASPLDDGLRICASRIARSTYSLRNKRNIAHIGTVDPNIYDLRYIFSAAQWIMAELVRVIGQSTMEQAGKLIEQINSPVMLLVEEIQGKRIVYGNLSTREEILVLLHSIYPDPKTTEWIVDNLERTDSRSVGLRIRELWREKMLGGDRDKGYVLTQPGFQEAIRIISKNLNNGE
jgi:hypothetical protein